MKAISIAVVLATAVMFSGCCNLKARTAPKPCLSNPCMKAAACAPCKTIEK